MMRNLGLNVVMRCNYTSEPIIIMFSAIYQEIVYLFWIFITAKIWLIGLGSILVLFVIFFLLQNLCNSQKCLDI